MQIIKGEFKHRKLKVPKGIRPVSLRVKKSLFDVVKDSIPGAKVLDLFAGSGSLGIEALSLGADQAVFVENSRSCASVIRSNLKSLKTDRKTEVICKDVFSALKDFHCLRYSFDLIFLDPPYYRGLARKALQTIDGYDIVSKLGLIVESCFYKDETISDYSKFFRVYSKQYGQTQIAIYQKQDEKGFISGDI